MLFPRQLSCDWSLDCIPMVTQWMDPRNLLSAGAYGVVTYLGYEAWLLTTLGQPFLLFSGLFLLVPAFPASNIAADVATTIAERLLYLPLVGYCLLLSYLIAYTFVQVCCLLEHDGADIWSYVGLQPYGKYCLPSTACPQMFALKCLPSTACPQLLALNCLPSAVCPQLFALNCLPSTNT